jgi:peptide/nickel transport system substrate-binding protein
MEAIRVISDSLKDVGINVKPEFPDYNALVDARNSGNFDLVINNDRQIANSPWYYYDYLFRLPILEVQSGLANYGRYENPEAWELTQQLDKTPVDDLEGMRRIISQLQRIQLTEMPAIPLWYNGLWSQANTSVWTNWPSAENGGNHFLPSTWRGYWNMGAIMMLTELEPAPQE